MHRVRNRLGQLSRRLGEADWLDGAFSAGDLMMVSVLQAESIGIAGRIPEPLRLCGPRRSAARLQAGLRGAIGGFHWQGTGGLMNVDSGLEAVIALGTTSPVLGFDQL